MDLKGILAISGKPGLYRHVSQTRSGIIIESLTDKKRIHAFTSAKISALQDISIYTEEGDMQLFDVFKKIFEKFEGQKAISHKSSTKELLENFTDVLPEFDKDRVYTSDIKRVFQWYNLLQSLGLVDLEDSPKEEKELPAEKKEDKKEPQEKATPKKTESKK